MVLATERDQQLEAATTPASPESGSPASAHGATLRAGATGPSPPFLEDVYFHNDGEDGSAESLAEVGSPTPALRAKP